VKTYLSRQQTESQQLSLSKDARMVYKLIREFKNGKSYHVYLLERNRETLISDHDVMY
jgi:hypothetical protein